MLRVLRFVEQYNCKDTYSTVEDQIRYGRSTVIISWSVGISLSMAVAMFTHDMRSGYVSYTLTIILIKSFHIVLQLKILETETQRLAIVTYYSYC